MDNSLSWSAVIDSRQSEFAAKGGSVGGAAMVRRDLQTDSIRTNVDVV